MASALLALYADYIDRGYDEERAVAALARDLGISKTCVKRNMARAREVEAKTPEGPSAKQERWQNGYQRKWPRKTRLGRLLKDLEADKAEKAPATA